MEFSRFRRISVLKARAQRPRLLLIMIMRPTKRHDPYKTSDMNLIRSQIDLVSKRRAQRPHLDLRLPFLFSETIQFMSLTTTIDLLKLIE